MVAVDVEITEGTRLMAMAVKTCVEADAVMMAVVLKVVGKVQATTVMRAALMTADSGRDNGGSERW